MSRVHRRKIGYINTGKCDRKLRYTHPLDAEEAAKRHGKELGHALYVYNCIYCGLWHLTKEPQPLTPTVRRAIVPRIEPISKGTVPGNDGYYQFMCPGCLELHVVPLSTKKEPGHAWKWNGDVNFPTLTPSILVNKGKIFPDQLRCHSFIKNGRIEFLSDCEHSLAGKIVDLMEIEDAKPEP